MGGHRIDKNNSRKNKKYRRGNIIMEKCVVIKKGKECPFATKDGCFFADGQCDKIVQHCEGCSKIEVWPDGNYCSSCPAPATKWTRNSCNMASHLEKETKEVKHVDPLKASKRSMRGH
jgi:hypothetical protein